MAGTRSLVGRESELRRIDALLRNGHERGGALVLSGEPGIGKSALLASARVRAAELEIRVLTAVGVQSETLLAFAGLHQLLRPVLDHVDELPAPQRDALLTAFGMSEGSPPDFFRTALAALDLLSEAAAKRPLVVIAEDAHWLDRSTADVLVFVARRLEYEPVVLLAAIRDGFESPLEQAGLPTLHVGPLDRGAAGALLDESAPDASQAVRRRVLEEAGGNPLALIELPVGFGQIEAGARPPTWLPLTTRLARAFAARLHDLPVATRTTMLVAALNDSSSLSEVLAAGGRLIGSDLSADALVPAASARLAELDETEIAFRHPLMRAAIAQQASLSQRHAAHAALADVLADQPERRVWHRAASVPGPDETVAAELEDASERARRRGAAAIAFAALERAAKFSDSSRRAGRLLRAAELGFELGRRELVVGLLQEASRLELGALEQAKVAWIRDSFTDGVPGDPAQACSLAATADQAATDGDVDLAFKLLNRAALRCWWSDLGESARNAVLTATERLDVAESDPRLLPVLAFAGPIRRGGVVLDRVSEVASATVLEPGAARLLGTAATAVGAFDLASSLLATSVAGLRVQGRLGLLARALTLQAWSAAQLADLNVGIPAAEEAVRLARETSQPVILATAQATQAILAALGGEEDAAEALAAEVEQVCVPIGASASLAAVQSARGLAALGARRYTDALEHLSRLYDPHDVSYHMTIRCFVIAELTEAAIRAGQRERARSYLDEMETLGEQTPSPALHAGLVYARALMAEDASAEQLFESALRSNLGASRFRRARVQLAYGEWLRRRKRHADARAPLRAAREAFDALGTIPWSERARQQLRATGETSRRRTPEARDQLTAQELQIAQLAAKGLTNREIGQMLFLSPRTISSHLYRAFPKLDITSRAELHTVLERAVPAPE